MTGNGSMAKLYIIQTVQKALTTAQGATHGVHTCKNQAIIQKVTELLLESCQIPDLILISTALDAFYDIFSEDYYNQVLLENDVIAQMAKGQEGLAALYKRSKQEKLLSKSELGNVENALENLAPFIEYKRKEMKLK